MEYAFLCLQPGSSPFHTFYTHHLCDEHPECTLVIHVAVLLISALNGGEQPHAGICVPRSGHALIYYTGFGTGSAKLNENTWGEDEEHYMLQPH